MTVMDVPSGVLSALPELRPLASAALALNIAYINLERFRYLKELNKFGGEALKELDEHLADSNTSQTDDYMLLEWFAGKTKNSKNVTPLMRLSYGLFNKTDRWLSIGFALVSAMVIILGSANSIDLWGPSKKLFSIGSGYLTVGFYLLAIGFCIASLFSFMGKSDGEAWRKHW